MPLACICSAVMADIVYGASAKDSSRCLAVTVISSIAMLPWAITVVSVIPSNITIATIDDIDLVIVKFLIFLPIDKIFFNINTTYNC